MFKGVLSLLRKIFLEDLPYKFASLVLAVLLWVYVDGELMGQRSLEVQLRPVDLGLPENLRVVAGSELLKFSLQIRGPRRTLQFITSENIALVRPPLDKAVSGRNQLILSPSDFDAPGFDIISVTPKGNQQVFVYLAPAKDAK